MDAFTPQAANAFGEVGVPFQEKDAFDEVVGATVGPTAPLALLDSHAASGA
jgi:hypothetical protein